MKLHNKKTGEIWDIPNMRHSIMQEDDISFFAYGRDDGRLFSYKSLAELNEEWEDYTPQEPLIKDERIRKALRAWADANDIDQKNYHDNNVKFNFLEHRFKWIETSIEFNDIKGLENLKDGWEYTIDELCGEEDE